MKRFLKLTLTGLILLVSTLLSAQTSMTYNFNDPLLSNTEDGYTSIVIDNCYNLGEEGTPLLPYYGANILLPLGTEIKEIKILSISFGESYSDKIIQPAPGQFPISKGAPKGYKAVADASIYNSNESFPSSVIGYPATEFLAGHSIGTFSICPVIYHPKDSELSLIKSITLEIITQTTDQSIQAASVLKNHPSQIRRIRKIIDNPDNLLTYNYPDNKSNEYDILFITDQALEPYFAPYISFKTETGYLVKTITTDYIYANYSGNDNQEKIRNCVIDYYSNFNIFAVILGGDADKNNPAQDFVPHRGFYGVIDNDYDLPADMYYACLDGNWNNDGDLKWGEPGEDDLFAEVIVGRIAVDDSTEIAHFMHKQFMYQDQPVVADIEKALMLGEALDASTWGGDSKDEIATGSSNNGITTVGVAPNFTIEYLYERDGWWNKSHVFDQFNNTGINLINHLGHSNTYYNMKMYTSDVTTSNFTNDGISRGYTIGYSQGCYNGSFDNRGTSPSSYGADCFAEKITTIETAEVACIANSRYGLYSPGTTNGPSQLFDREFYDAIFGEDLCMIGEANGDSKSDLAAFIAGNSGLRWCCYILNVFGDPTLDIWTAVPTPITATYPAAVALGTASITFQTDAPGARIGLVQNGELIGRGLTDNSGDLVLNLFAQISIIDTIQVSIIGHNKERHFGEITVIAGQPFVCYESHYINDTILGNGNGLSEYGETVKLSLKVTNMGELDATDVNVTITAFDQYMIIHDSSAYYGDILPGQSIIVPDGFEISLTDQVPDGHELLITVLAEGQDIWESSFIEIACAPAFTSGLLSIDDSGTGNGNGQFDPGETADIHIEIINSGHSRAININGLVSSDDPMVNIISNASFVDTLEVNEIFEAIYTVFTDPLSQLGATFQLVHDIEAGPYVQQRIYNINNGLICEDWETGNFNRFNWTHSGQQSWEITDVNPFEGVFSARSGNITHEENSTIQIGLFVEEDDSISFFRKTSSEASDFLNFYINNVLKGQWAGDEDWERVSYPVEEGVTFFKWEYAKNASNTSGEDCSWLDYIVLPFVNTASAYAGPDQLICETGICSLSGEALNYNSVEWISSGDGSFDDPEILDPIYSPGPDDIAMGGVDLTLGATYNQTGTTFDVMHLSIDGNPGIPDMPDGPEYVDLLTVTSSEYTSSALPSIIEYEWKLDPDEAGIIEGNGTIGTVTWEPTYHGLAYVSVRAIDTCGPGLYSDEFEVLVDEGGLGIIEPGSKASLAIYPNPNEGTFTLEATSQQLTNLNIKVFNASGTLILHEKACTKNNVFIKHYDLSAYQQGLYFIQLTGEGISITKKLILQ